MSHPPEPTDADLEVTIDRTIRLMHLGLTFADAAELAIREVANEVVERHDPTRARQVEAEPRNRFDRSLRAAEERARYRAQLDLKARKPEPPPPGPRAPTLKASLGDRIRFKLG